MGRWLAILMLAGVAGLLPFQAHACCVPTNDNDNNNDNDNRLSNTTTATSTSDSTNNAQAAGGNSTVNVSTGAGRGGNRTLFIPAVVPSSPAAAIGVGQISAMVGTCGPLQTVVRTPIIGTFVGLFKHSKIEQGYDEVLAPYVVNGVQQDYREVHMPDGSIRLMGHQPLTFVTVVGIAAARNLALGGGHASDWGQAGGSSSSSMQQLVTRIQLRDCEVGTLYADPVVPRTTKPAAE